MALTSQLEVRRESHWWGEQPGEVAVPDVPKEQNSSKSCLAFNLRNPCLPRQRIGPDSILCVPWAGVAHGTKAMAVVFLLCCAKEPEQWEQSSARGPTAF